MSSENQGRVLTGKMMDEMYTFAPRPLVRKELVMLACACDEVGGCGCAGWMGGRVRV
jgi:hypothetical protein